MRFQKTPGLAKGSALDIPNVGPGLAPRSYKLAIRASSKCGSTALLSKDFTQRCHSERSEESRSDSFFRITSSPPRAPDPPKRRARFLAALGMTPVVCFLALALTLLLLPSCSRKTSGGEGEDTEEGTANIVAEVTVTRVGRADIQSTLSVSGTVSALPNQDVRVSSLVPGRVARMMVAEGDRVREGQVLAKIDDRPFRDQVQQAQAAVDQAKANLENSRLNLQRNEKLLERGIAARKDVEDARTQASVNKAALSQAEAALSLARLNLARTEVRSPLTGMIVKRLLSVGEQVDGTAAQPVFEVASTSEVELFGNVPALYLDKIRVGQALRNLHRGFSGQDISESHCGDLSRR